MGESFVFCPARLVLDSIRTGIENRESIETRNGLSTFERYSMFRHVLLRYVLIYNLEISSNFHITVFTVKCDYNVDCTVKNCFFPSIPVFSLSSQ